MSCSKCKNAPCGCEDQGLTTGTPCAQDTPSCPNPDPCAESFSDCCVIHNNDSFFYYIDEFTPNGLTINQGDRICEILQKLMIANENPACVDPTNSCNSVVGIQSTAITSTSIAIKWNPAVGATGYILQVKLATDPTFTNTALPSTASTASIGGLLPNTDYHIRIATVCTNPPDPDCFSVTLIIKTKTA